MTKDQLQAMHRHLNIRIRLKNTLIAYCQRRATRQQVDFVIDQLEESTASLVAKGYYV